MAPRLPGPKHAGRHEWNSYEDYKKVNERQLAHYSFIEDLKVAFMEILYEGTLFIGMEATLSLPKNVMLEVTKYLATERRGKGRGRLYVRTFSYRYNAWIKSKHAILRYDNNDDLEDYHGHWWAVETGDLLERRSIARDDFSVFSEVLDELDKMMDFTSGER